MVKRYPGHALIPKENVMRLAKPGKFGGLAAEGKDCHRSGLSEGVFINGDEHLQVQIVLTEILEHPETKCLGQN